SSQPWLAVFFVPALRDYAALHSFPTRRSSDLGRRRAPKPVAGCVRGAPPSRRRYWHARETAGRAPAAARARRGRSPRPRRRKTRSEEHTSELQSPYDLVCRLLLEKKKTTAKKP